MNPELGEGLGRRQLGGVSAGVAVILIWSGWITLSRYGVGAALTVYDITALRFGSAALVTAPLWWTYPWRRVRWWRASVVALGCGFPYTLLTFLGLRSIGAAQAGVLVNGSLPVASAVLSAVWLRQRPSRGVWLTCAAVLVADLCMSDVFVRSPWLGTSGSRLGIVYLLLAAFTLATYMTAVRAWGFGVRDVLVLVPLINALSFVPIWWLALPSSVASAPLSQIAIQAGYQGIVASVLALILFTKCLETLGSVSSALCMALVPVVTASLAWLTLGERLSAWQWTGIGVCSAALVYHAFATVRSASARRAVVA